MTTKAADDFEAIRRRLEEIEAEQKLALTGSSAPMSEEPKDVESVYGSLYSAVSNYVNGSNFNLPDVERFVALAEERLTGKLKSTAHPEWPYAGTAHEWRGFVNQK